MTYIIDECDIEAVLSFPPRLLTDPLLFRIEKAAPATTFAHMLQNEPPQDLPQCVPY